VSGKIVALTGCLICGRIFDFNPAKVPSIPIDPETMKPPDVDPQPGGYERAVRQPLCESCVKYVNLRRAERGQTLIEVLPGAYDAADSSELDA
jgi:hypothetical protein